MLTIGMATYQDFQGVYFTVQALRLYHQCDFDIEILVVDNLGKRGHEHGCEQTHKAVAAVGGRYIHAPQTQGTAAPRDLVFREAKYPYVVCIDSHVLLTPGSLQTLMAHYRANPNNTKDMIQGCLLYDDHQSYATHFRPEWGDNSQMFGVWDDNREARLKGRPFEIPMQGLGMFSIRKDTWPGFNPNFRGFGGEEGYIHEKVRMQGGRCLCLPGVQWVHRFDRGGPIPYHLSPLDRIVNYLVGWRELGLDETGIIDHFTQFVKIDIVQQGLASADGIIARPDATRAFGLTQNERIKTYTTKLKPTPNEVIAIVDRQGNYMPVVMTGEPPRQPQIAATVRDGDSVREMSPEARRTALGCWYSDRSIPPNIERESLDSVLIAKEALHDVEIVTCAPIAYDIGGLKNLPPHLVVPGQLGAVMQILRILYDRSKEYDYVFLLEHNALYPPDYFDLQINTMEKHSARSYGYFPAFTYLNQRGFDTIMQDRPSSYGLVFRGSQLATTWCERVLRTCIETGDGDLVPNCSLEDYCRAEMGDIPIIRVISDAVDTLDTFAPKDEYWGHVSRYFPSAPADAPRVTHRPYSLAAR